MLGPTGWAVQDADVVNFAAAQDVAARKFILKPPHSTTSPALVEEARRRCLAGVQTGGYRCCR
jgi:hypothetical protein